MSYKWKLLVWGKCHHQMGGPPMGFAGFTSYFVHPLSFLLKSCWSDAAGPQQLCRCAKPSDFWPQNVELRERQLHNLRPRVSFNVWYCPISSCQHDTSIGLTNSMQIPWCAVLFWKKSLKNTQVRIQYPVSRVKSYRQLGNHACLVFHSNPPLGKQTATPNSTIQMAPQHLLLGKSEETLEPGLLP